MKSSTRSLLAHSSFWLATAVMVLQGWTLYQATIHEAESAQRDSHTREVLQAVTEIREQASRTESAQRGYLLSGSKTFLAERDAAHAELNDSLARVKQLTLDNPDQQPRLSELGQLFALNIANMQAAGKRGVGATNGITAAEAETAVRIQSLITELKRDERQLQRVHRADAEARRTTERRVLIAEVLFGALVIIPGYLGFVFQSRKRKRTEKMLRVMADSLPGAVYQLRHPAHGKPRLTFIGAGISNVSDVHASAATLPDWDALVNVIDERDRPAFDAALAASTMSLDAFRQSYRIRYGDGTSKCLYHEASLRQEAKDSILQNGYIVDITEQRQLEDALLKAKDAADSANRAKSTFLATMSHEIRTPMNGALGMLELLSLTRLDDEQRATLAIVRDSSQSLLRILDDILDFSMIEAEKLAVRVEVVSIGDVIEGVRNIYSGNASSKGLHIQCSTDPRISPAVLTDPLRLRQILGNFVSNALKFTTHGAIEIKAEWVGRSDAADQVRFLVTDTGIGISAEDQQRLFQPFAQANDEQGRHYGGTGLGLVISRRLAGMMGGEVTMESALGKGTTMQLTLSLPIADPQNLPKSDREEAREYMRTSSTLRRQAPTVSAAEREGTLVLVVDDHPINRALLTRQVDALGYAVESAENGVDALAKWQSGRFGLIITDCHMPEMDGYELARRIRALESVSGSPRTPMIACTANAQPGEVEVCRAAGMDDCLAKPVELAQILKKLDQWLPIPASAALPSATVPEQPPQTTVATPPLDRAQLAAISAGDLALERTLLSDFREANREDAARLKQAMATQDLSEVTRATHRMSGASKLVGAVGFAMACDRIGVASSSGDWTTAGNMLQAFDEELMRLNRYCEAL